MQKEVSLSDKTQAKLRRKQTHRCTEECKQTKKNLFPNC